MTYTIGSLFSGYGGLDMGVQMALGPARVAWVSDIEPGPTRILTHHHPDAPNLGDITSVDWTQVEPVDVIAGGSPCQDLSAAGRRAGMRPGTRSGLWESMAHAISIIRPRLVVWENVQGALSAEAFSLMESREGRVGDRANGPVLRALGRVLGDLAAIGYDAQWVGLRASDIGACHQRYRVFVVAFPAGDSWWVEQRERAYVGDADVLGGDGGSTSRYGGAVVEDADRAHLIFPTPMSAHHGWNKSPGDGSLIRPSLDTIAKTFPTPRASEGEKSGPNQHGSKGDLTLSSAVFDYGEYTQAVRRQEMAFGLPAPQPTVPGKTGRRLSPAFVEWMMGLPEGHVTSQEIGLSRVQQLRALGNGVVPQQAAHAIRLMADRERAIEWGCAA